MGGSLERHKRSSEPDGDATAEATPLGLLEHLQYVERDRVGLITINRPTVHNAISLATMAELERVLQWLETESQVGAVVLTGAGDRIFVSGGDLKDFEQLTTHESAAAMSRRMQLVIGASGDAAGAGDRGDQRRLPRGRMRGRAWPRYSYGERRGAFRFQAGNTGDHARLGRAAAARCGWSAARGP